MNKTTQWLFFASRIIIGIVFIYSGFVKVIDPLGTTYKLNDYFAVFGTDWATKISFILAVIQNIAEFVIGVALLLNLKMKLSSLGALIFMIIFTPLTLYVAIANPVHDCGCFGDALVITNWQTFWKNIILLFPTVFLFMNRKKSTSILNCWEQWGATVIIIILAGMFTTYSYNHLPLKDFRPYKIGTYIPDGMVIPEGAPADEWESTFIYSKDGVEKEFNMSALPDSTWAFIDAKHDLIKKGYEPPIHDFTIISIDGTEITDIVLSSDNYNFLFIAYNLQEADRNNINKVNELADYCYQMNYPFYGLTASGNDDVNEFISETDAIYEFYNTDEITLKTIIRSNPGLVLLKNGTIIDKWHINDIPSISELNENLVHQSITKYKSSADKYFIWVLILLSGFIVSLYLLVRKSVCKC